MNGSNILGFKYSAMADRLLSALNPSTQKILKGQFHIATTEEIDEAMSLATSAYQTYKDTSPKERAAFLNAIADEIMGLGDALVERTMAESGLPKGRVEGERGRTVNQLRLFAKVVEEGSWVEASIDTAIPDRTPFPKADIRKMLVPTGPVVVYTASNFPLAFSTAGGDTASALASGNPVVVKAHESHLGVNALVSIAIQRAAERTGMPDGVFSSLNGTGLELGQALVKHPLTKSVAFTGSLKAGKAIFDAAAERAEPIPVFSEMGSINPVVILDEALAKRGDQIAKQYAGSVTLGVGQFCTNPGILVVKDGEGFPSFVSTLAAEMQQMTPATMLNENVCANYNKSKDIVLNETGVSLEGESSNSGEGLQGRPTVASVDAKHFISNPKLQEEVFGPFTMIIKCSNDEDVLQVIQSLKGQLTATIMGEENELPQQKDVIHHLQERVGRIIFNGVPTGVEVCHSMQHGGPFPATTDSRFTSVGTGAIKRFVRPIAFQNWPQALLPAALKDANPLGIWRLLNGEQTKDAAS